MEGGTTARDGSPVKYAYWLQAADFRQAKQHLKKQGFRFSQARLVPCKVLRVSGKKLMYAAPRVWSRFCYRQGSWYRESPRVGKYLLVSAERLPPELDRFCETAIAESDFLPASLPTEAELQRLVESPCYQEQKPGGWERVMLYERIMLWVVYNLTGFGTWRETFDTHWLAHRANHANFLCRQFTTDRNGRQVAYTLSENRSVCSACVEFFNLVSPGDPKLVRACPGSILSGGTKKELFYEITPKPLG